MRRLGFILFALIVLYFIFLIRQDIMDNRGLKGAEQNLTRKLGQEVKLADRLQNRLKLLKQDARIEELARTRLGLIKKGEKAYKVIVE